MTEDQKFLFDLKGWLLLPAVLSEAECAVVKESLANGGNGFTGAAQELLDHPALVDVLTAILSSGKAPDDYYDFRCEGSFYTVRQGGWKPTATDIPHTGARPVSAMGYRSDGKHIFSGLTRAVWELNPVEHGDGGTLFLSGTHKANFDFPASVYQPNNPYLESYSCPAGSLLVFTETLLHAATDWNNPDVERFALFNCYNSTSTQHHRLNLSHELISSMPPKRQSLFRGTYLYDFAQEPYHGAYNRYYSLDNRSL